jgi:sulfate adenylyltransferase subunit 2
MVRDHLTALENESVYILREAFSKFHSLAMLWSIGKDSTVLLWLARKAFFGHVPFPLVHIDTSYKIASMIEYRDRMVRECNLQLVVGRNDAVLASGQTFPNGRATRVECCSTLKKDALQQVIEQKNYTGVIVGVRRDEEPTRAKERYFSPRTQTMAWDATDQPPELWNQFKTDFAPGTHIRIHPLLHWTELNVWEYIETERIEIVPLYFAKQRPVVRRAGVWIMVDDDRLPLLPGEEAEFRLVRFRTLGCYPLTGAFESTAATVAEITAELRRSRASERQGRLIDSDETASMERKKRQGYF